MPLNQILFLNQQSGLFAAPAPSSRAFFFTRPSHECPC